MGDLRELWKDGVASSVDLLGEATVTQAEAAALRRALLARRSTTLVARVGELAGAPAARARLRGPAAAREPVREGVRAHAAAAARGPRARQARRRRAPARAAAPGARARRAPAHRHGVAGLARRRARAGAGAAGRGGVPRRAVGRHGAPGLPARLARARSTRSSPWLDRRRRAARHAADGPARQGRLLGPRDRRGPPARLGRRRCSTSRPTRTATSSRSPAGCSTRARRRGCAWRSRRHNLRSIAHAIAYNRLAGGEDDDLELQILRGLGDPLQEAIAARGLRVRAYCPVGDLVAGMAYLVRRLLENTSQRLASCADQARGVALDELLAAPGAVTTLKPFANEPVLELRRAPVRARLAEALRDARRQAAAARARVDRRRHAARARSSSRPTRATPTASSPRAAAATAGRGRRRAGGRRARLAGVGRDAGAEQRAEVLRARRRSGCASAGCEPAALAVRECAKPWPEADADVCEAIDFLEYYARGALDIDQGAPLLQVPGERNTMRYAPRGVVAVISPWNFPLAIPLGMVAAGLATGNAVVLKPAEQSPGLRADAGPRRCARPACPPDALALLPGEGDVGAALVEDPRVHTIAFTGSGAVGLEIVRAAAEVAPGPAAPQARRRRDGRQELRDRRLRRRPRRGRARARGARAFVYAGQKCSAAARVLVHEAIHDALARAARRRRRGARGRPGRRLRIDVPPVIEREAAGARRPLRRARRARRARRRPRRRRPRRRLVRAARARRRPARRTPPCSTEEIFGPLLAVERVRDVDEACDRVDASPFALTGGLFAATRTPSRRRRAAPRSATSTSTARSPARWSPASRSAATGCRAPAQGRRPRLPAAVRRAAGRDREHDAPRPRRLSTDSPMARPRGRAYLRACTTARRQNRA